MCIFVRAWAIGLVLGLLPGPARADEKRDPTAAMDAAAKVFLKAYHEKDVDAMMEVADVPFLVGTVRDPKVLGKRADLRDELKSRLAAGDKLAGKVAKTLTWDKAIPPAAGDGRQRKTREKMKPAIDVTGPDGGYAALADVKGKGLAVSGTRLLVGIRDGKAKVVGILVDPK